MKPRVLFFHGLNTFGDDELHIGPLRLGRMDVHVRPALEERGLEVLSIDGVGSGSPQEQAHLALQSMAAKASPDRDYTRSPQEIYLLGNSLGGLTARAFAAMAAKSHPHLNVRAIVTWGTPHRGAAFVESLERFFESETEPSLLNIRFWAGRTLAPILEKSGYGMDEKMKTFRHYSPRMLAGFNSLFPINAVAPEYSLLCLAPLRDVSPYFWPTYPKLHGMRATEFAARIARQDDLHAPSDGFISAGSQNWGERRGPFALDHFAQLGFTDLLPLPAQRHRARAEFNRLSDEIAAIVGGGASGGPR